MTKAQKIRLAGYLALGFVALRICYAFIFSGLGGERIILSLPSFRLSGPFSHITLLGDISVDGILRNIELALPFALSILGFGIAASFITPQMLQKAAHRFGPLRNLLSAVAIGLSSLPGLFDSARKVFRAQKLRGEKRSRLLVPILERALELANSIGLRLAMEPRGDFRAQGLSIRNLRIPDSSLGPIDLEIKPGEMVVLSGATGSGKSTLLEAIAGILTEYRGRSIEGTISFQGRSELSISEIANFVSYLPQNPREMLWGLEISELIDAIEPELAKRLGLFELAAKEGASLSEGEALKLLFAKNLAQQPAILLLDEPYAPLDSQSRLVLTQLLNELGSKGMTIVVVEHDPDHTAGLNAKDFHLDSGVIRDGRYQPKLPEIVRSQVLVGKETLLSEQLEDIGFGKLLIEQPRLTLSQAERVWLSGENGSGKTSLLRALEERVGFEKLVFVPEHFDDFFVTDSLQAELARADSVAKVPEGFTKATLSSILPDADLEAWAKTHPRDLSRGTRLALAISMQLSHKPQVLLIDEPFRGLDERARELMVHSLSCVAETGCAVLFASHEKPWSEALCSRKLAIKDRKLTEIVEVSA